MEEDNLGFDGNWTAAGLKGMFVLFDSDTFCDDQMRIFESKNKGAGGMLRQELEFLTLPLDGEETEQAWARLQQQILQPRELRIADGVVRRFAGGNCQPRILIQKLSSTDMDKLLKSKKLGNEAFGKKEYEQALEHYSDALSVVVDFFVAPMDQMQQIVNILSNQAECYLRLKKYKDAGQATTDALMFDNSHEKSRLRRAKAALAIAGAEYLIQAQVDLEEIVSNNQSKDGVKQAKALLEGLEEILEMEKSSLEKKNPDSDWGLYVQIVKASCW